MVRIVSGQGVKIHSEKYVCVCVCVCVFMCACVCMCVYVCVVREVFAKILLGLGIQPRFCPGERQGCV